MLGDIFNSALLETLVSLVLVYALLSLVASAIVEVVNYKFKARGKMLYLTISSMFEDKLNVNFGHLLYDHRKDRSNLPQYIGAETFSSAMIDVIGNFGRTYRYNDTEHAIVLQDDQRSIFKRCRDAIFDMKHTDVKLMLMNMIDKCDYKGNNDDARALAAFDKQLRQWFNAQMDRTTGWYKSLTAARLKWVGFFMALALNIDSISMFTQISESPALRSKLVAIAEATAASYKAQLNDTTLTGLDRAYRSLGIPTAKHLPDTVKPDIKEDTAYLHYLLALIKKLDSVKKEVTAIDSIHRKLSDSANNRIDALAASQLPFGWRRDRAPANFEWKISVWPSASWWQLLKRLFWYLLGLIITMYAISSGAPFWFDMLLKIVNIRKSGVRPDPKSSNPTAE